MASNNFTQQKIIASNNFNFNTPIKNKNINHLSSTQNKLANKSPNNYLTLNTSSYTNKNQSAVQNSLIQKIIQNRINKQQQYQNRLIYNKQLQLKILNLQQKSQLLRKQYKKANKPLQQIKQKIQSSRISLIQKQKYLQKFYVHLDSKLKSNMQSNLFNRLQKIQTALQQKYQQQRQQLYQSLEIHHQKIQKENQELQKFKQYRDQLIKQYTEKAIQVSSQRAHSSNGSNSGKKQSLIRQSNPKQIHKLNGSSKNSNNEKSSGNSKSIYPTKQNQLKSKQNEHKMRKQAKQKEKAQVFEQLQYLKQNIKKLNKQKQIVQKDEKVLKLLLNIDQEHKKYSNYILNGLKKLFTIKFREVLAKRKDLNKKKQNQRKSTTFEPIKENNPVVADVQKVQKQLDLKKKQRKQLQQRLEQGNKKLQKCKQRFNLQLQQFSRLQQELMQANNNKNSKGNNRISYNVPAYEYGSHQDHEGYNPRATYSPMKHTF